MSDKIALRAARLWTDRQGVTAMEYGMIAAATIVAIAGFMLSISGSISSIFSTISTSI